MTSTMKSDPGGPFSEVAGACGVPVSAAATRAFGGNADGRRGSGCGAAAVAASAAVAGGTVPAAPAIAAVARNLRRSSFGEVFLADIVISPNSFARGGAKCCPFDTIANAPLKAAVCGRESWLKRETRLPCMDVKSA